MFSKKKGIKRKKQGAAVLVILSALFLFLMLGFYIEDYYQSQIILNEICSNNESYMSEEEQTGDYIELYNKGRSSYKMKGLYLSDDLYELKKIALDGIEIPAGGLYVVWCQDSGNSFSINKKGEYIYLSNEDGRILDKIEVSKLEKDTAYIRNTDGEWQVGSCTPNMQNDTVIINSVNMPVLSHASGFYDEEFDLEITSSGDSVIYYTLDGSVPDEGSYLYEGPIRVYDKSAEPNVVLAVQNVVRKWQEYTPDEAPVDKAFLVRALAVDNAGNKSDVVTATYFVNRDDFETRRVVSIVTDPKNLYDAESGIYVTGAEFDEWYLNGEEGDQPIPNFRKKGREWEREAVFELFDDTESLLQQNVGIRIQGSGSREQAMKRFSIYARDEYSGSDYFDIPLFDSDIGTHSLVLRTNIGDCICQGMLTDRDIPHQRYKRAYVFLNGEYIYGSWIQEKYNNQYYEDYYGIDKGNLIVIEGNGVNRGVETDMILYKELYRFIEENDFSDDTMYRELGDIMDIQSYIDFVAANIYCANMDVEMELTKNVMMWRSREIQDGKYGDTKWRFALYDMDSMQWLIASDYGVDISAQIDVFNSKFSEEDSSYNETVIYTALRKNDEFCKQFVITCMDMMNTSFSVENATAVLESLGRDIEWCDAFFRERPTYMKQHVAQEFELSGTIEKVTLHNEDETEGKIILNTITPAMENGSWTGEYFTDYPVTVTADPMEGYEFVGWSGSVVSDEITIEVPVTEGGIELTAEFQKIN